MSRKVRGKHVCELAHKFIVPENKKENPERNFIFVKV